MSVASARQSALGFRRLHFFRPATPCPPVFPHRPLRGGNISLFTELAERTRAQAFDTMLHQAHLAGANAVIGVRYDANELMQGVTEVLCYGTAVRVERA